MTRQGITNRITAFIKTKGTKNCRGEYELGNIFSLCADYGFDLQGSTIDKLEIEYEGHIRFYFNENTNDYGYETEFKVASLVEFFENLRNALKEEEKRELEEKEEEIRPIVDEALSSLVYDAIDRGELVDNILESVTKDVIETADEEFNDSDVRLAIVRVLLTWTKFSPDGWISLAK